MGSLLLSQTILPAFALPIQFPGEEREANGQDVSLCFNFLQFPVAGEFFGQLSG